MAVDMPEPRLGSAAFLRHAAAALAERAATMAGVYFSPSWKMRPFEKVRNAADCGRALESCFSHFWPVDFESLLLGTTIKRYPKEGRPEDARDVAIPGDAPPTLEKFLFDGAGALRGGLPIVAFPGRSADSAAAFRTWCLALKAKIEQIRFVRMPASGWTGVMGGRYDTAYGVDVAIDGVESDRLKPGRAGDRRGKLFSEDESEYRNYGDLNFSRAGRLEVARYSCGRWTYKSDHYLQGSWSSRGLSLLSDFSLCNPTQTKADVYLKVEFEGTPADTGFPTTAPLLDALAPGKWHPVGSVDAGDSFQVVPVLSAKPPLPFICEVVPDDPDQVYIAESGDIECFLSAALDFGPYFNYLPSGEPVDLEHGPWNDAMFSYDPPEDAATQSQPSEQP